MVKTTTSTRQLARRRPGVYGILLPGSILTVEGVMHATGMGEESLAAARESGIVRPIYLGRRVFYRSDELIEWITSVASVATDAGRTPSNANC